MHHKQELRSQEDKEMRDGSRLSHSMVYINGAAITTTVPVFWHQKCVSYHLRLR